MARLGDKVAIITGAPHVGEPTDIGYGMLYLASDEAKYITGEELVIDCRRTTH